MSRFNLSVDGGVAVIRLDGPDRVNKLSVGMLEDFGALLDRIESDNAIEAAVLISGKPESFVVGADIEAFKAFESLAEVEATIYRAHALMNRLEGLSKPVVAAVNGACAGGGLELALACRYRLATTHPKTVFALPEVKLGLLPGAGGTQRLPRAVGLQKGLELMLSGKNVYPAQAKKLGLVDALIHPPGLEGAAKRAALGLAAGRIGRRKPQRGWQVQLLERGPLERVVYQKAEDRVRKQTRGNYPAPLKIIDCVRAGREHGLAAGLGAEATHFAELLFTPEARALIDLFFSKNAAEKNPYASRAREIDTVGVLGAGLMGSGIAQISAAGGYEVRLKDRSLELAAKGKKAIYKDVSRRVGKGLTAFERDRITARVTPVENYAPLEPAGLVIEAVLEDLELKRRVLRDVEAATGEQTVYASNTSSIPITEIAAAAERPEQVIGMHYFSPAQKMPLLEIVKTDTTPDWVLATAYAVGLAQGKTIITVNDSPGFYTTRILAVYMDEALHLLAEGARVERVDRAMRDAGFPVGPLALLDEVGIDVGAKISAVLQDLFAARGITPPQGAAVLVEADYRGRKNGRGFYRYEGKGKKEVNADVYRFFGGNGRAGPSTDEITERLLLVMVNEALRCLEEGILDSPRDGDVGAVFGLGFPPFLGGPFYYVDTRDPGEVLTRLQALERAHGPRFEPAGLLREKAEQGAAFYDDA